MSIHTALISIRPGVEFVMHGDDVTTVDWQALGVEPVTQAEAESESARLNEIAEAQRRSTLAKLAAIGLTPEDLASLGIVI